MLSRVFADLVAASYDYFRARRRLPILVLLALIATSAFLFQAAPRREDVSALLPDGPGEAAEQFRLLQRAPFARKITLLLTADPALSDDEARARLAASADALAARLAPPLFTRAAAGPDLSTGPALLPRMAQALPRLATPEDLREIEARIAPDEVVRRIRAAYFSLLSPEGLALKTALREDPLGFRDLGLRKLRHGNLLGGVDASGGRFMSRDGRHALVFADTPVAFTDVTGAQALVTAFEAAATESAAPGVRAEMLSAHRYTLANAQTIKRDLTVILTAASAAILLLFLLFLRGWGALWVFLLPFGALAFAGAVAGTALGGINGITLGFGSVLLGISVDYGIYVYSACRFGGEAPARSLHRLAGPILFGMLTTVAGFLVLFSSSLPGQRELALFAVSGIAMAFAAALFALPHLLPSGAGAPRPLRFDALLPTGRPRRWLVGVWCAALALLALHAPDIRFAGDLKRLGVVPDDLRAVERTVADLLGNAEGKALFVAEGATDEATRAATDALVADLAARLPDATPLSLSPLLPSLARQEENLARWRAFWTPQRRAELEKNVRAAALPLGFTPDAFAPFFQKLAGEAPPLDAATWRGAGLGDLVDALSFEEKGARGMLTMLPDTPEARGYWRERAAFHPGVRMVSPAGLAELLSEAIREDFTKFVVLAALAVAGLTALLLRSWRLTFAALTPAAASLVALFGVSGLLGIEFDLFNIVGAILLSGITVDYGIFMACRDPSGEDRHTAPAVALAALNTLAGVGSLALARHPALFSVGLTVSVGVLAALPTALWITPLLRGKGKA